MGRESSYIPVENRYTPSTPPVGQSGVGPLPTRVLTWKDSCSPGCAAASQHPQSPRREGRGMKTHGGLDRSPTAATCLSRVALNRHFEHGRPFGAKRHLAWLLISQ